MKTNPWMRILLMSGLLPFLNTPLRAQVLFSEDFTAGYSSEPENFNGGQYESSLTLAHSGDLTNWIHLGQYSVHVVDKANEYNDNSNPVDYALMIWDYNELWQDTGIVDSNVMGNSYEVAFEMSPAVYKESSQQTTATDGIIVDLLRPDDSVFSTQTFNPGAWAGNLSFTAVKFTYEGDGTGDLRILLRTANSGNDHFGGAMDNLSLSQIPEPAAPALAGLSGLMLLRRNRRK